MGADHDQSSGVAAGVVTVTTTGLPGFALLHAIRGSAILETRDRAGALWGCRYSRKER